MSREVVKRLEEDNPVSHHM